MVMRTQMLCCILCFEMLENNRDNDVGTENSKVFSGVRCEQDDIGNITVQLSSGMVK